MTTSDPVRLTARATKLARKGRPWFFADDLVKPPGAAALVRVAGDRGQDLGLGFASTTSKIRLRLCGPWDDGVPSAEDFFAQRLEAAVAMRAGLRGPRRGTRLVHGEADQLPGLVVDEYDRCLVLQATSAYLEANYDAIVPALVAFTGAEVVIARNDVSARKLEGLPREVRLLHGRRIETWEIEEDGLVHTIAPFTGHKTGFYLDQRPARARVRELAGGGRVLDTFCYQGGFALSALAGGAVSALAIDQSAAAIERVQETAERHGLPGLEVRCGNVFDAFRDLRRDGARFDLIVVDPPAFAKTRREVRGAERGYRELNRHAMRLLAPGGHLVTCSCSHHVSGPMFEDLLRQAAAELPFRMFLRERLGAGDDHPVWLSLPESEYLKVRVLQRAPAAKSDD